MNIIDKLLNGLLIFLILFILGCAEPKLRPSLSERAQKIILPYKQEVEDELKGAVKWFNSSKGYGFITIEGEEGLKDRNIFVHHSAIQGGINKTLHKGDIVKFHVGQGQKGPVASNVRILELHKETLHARDKAFTKTEEDIDCDFNDNIACKVRVIIKEEFGRSFKEVTLEAKFVEDLGADSADVVFLMMAFEWEFRINIRDEDAEEIGTVKEAIQYIKNTVH